MAGLSLQMYSYKVVKAQGQDSLGYSYHAFLGLGNGVSGGIIPPLGTPILAPRYARLGLL